MAKDITDEDEWFEYEAMTTVVAEHPVDQSRWNTSYTMVVWDEVSKKYFKLDWESGSTECQDGYFGDFYHTVTEVKPVEVMTTVYKPV